MHNTSHQKFSSNPIVQITAIWTICFLLGSILSEISHTNIGFGLVFAETLSGLFTALVLRKTLPKLKFHYIVLVTIGWAMAGLITMFVISGLPAFD
jgi:hypothetical protein